MNEEKVRKILGDMIRSDAINEWLYAGNTRDTIEYVGLGKSRGISGVVLDGFFTPEKLEAIAWWIKNKQIIKERNNVS